jgi:histidinol-phosphate aminotransferase
VIKPPDYVIGIQPYVPGKPIEELERELGISNSIKLAQMKTRSALSCSA